MENIWLHPLRGQVNSSKQDGSRQQGQGVVFATNSFTKQDCIFLAKILTDKYGLKTPLLASKGGGGCVIKAGFHNQWEISIKKESMELLVSRWPTPPPRRRRHIFLFYVINIKRKPSLPPSLYIFILCNKYKKKAG